MRLAIVGSRGIPANYGGYETFAQELSSRLAELGMDVEVYCDYVENQVSTFNGVKLKYASCTKSSNPLKYYHDSVRSAEKENDFVLICGAGGAVFIYSKIFRRNVVYLTNMDGIEYRRTKWSLLKRLFVRFCIWASVYFSDYVVADSKGIKEFLLKKYRIHENRILQIEYGAYHTESVQLEFLKDLNLTLHSYYLVVSRLEPENNVETIIRGYLESGTKFPLIIIGNLLETNYVRRLLTFSGNQVRFIGGVYDKAKLETIRYASKAYFHGHSVGGTNPSLLEALGAGNFVIAHDNPFNREVTDNLMLYFSNPGDCAKRINEFEKMPLEVIDSIKKTAVSRITNYYNWERIAAEYYNFFNSTSK